MVLVFRYKATVSYDGTHFLGWQKQDQGRTVQTEIQKVLSQLLDTEIVVQSSGRTDAGVHAIGQVFHFDAKKELDIDKFRYALNRLLPDDIHVTEITKAAEDFHARYGAKAKHYRYLINTGEASPFYGHYRYELKRPLDEARVRSAAELFVGTHDFRNFTSKEEDGAGYVREIFSIGIEVKDGVFVFDFIGNGFMRYQVRMMIGVLVAIGLGQEEVDFVTRKMTDTKPRHTVRYKAPAQGLYLVSVSYSEV